MFTKSRIQINRAVNGFTLAGLSSVLTVSILLTGVFLSALAKARLRSVQLRCAANLRQLERAAQLYAQDEGRNRFPDCNGAVWPWDIPATAAAGLIRNGANRGQFYCPANSEQNTDFHWSFTSSVDETSGFRVIGYSLAFQGAGRVRPTNVTESLKPLPYRVGNSEFQPPPSARVLMADSTLSIGSDERNRSRNRYTGIRGGSTLAHRSAHMKGTLPTGGNLVFLDGHTEWRMFSKMRVRTTQDPAFWW